MILTKERDVFFYPKGIELVVGDLLFVRQFHSNSNVVPTGLDNQEKYMTYVVFSFQRVKNSIWKSSPHIMQNKIFVLCINDLKLKELMFFDSEIRDSKMVIIRK